MDLLYFLLSRLFKLLTAIFFREIVVQGSERIPKKEAIILVAAPHANQFVDPMVLIRTCNGRKIRFLMAASSLKHWLIGFFGKLMQSIPVERPLDKSKKATGRLVKKDNHNFSGIGTEFMTECFGEDKVIYFSSGPELYSFPVKRVHSDSLVEVSKSIEQLSISSDGIPFLVGGSLDHSSMYSAVYQVLNAGGTVGIFPEGGSHDRTSMLPLKAGVTVMALGSMYRNPLTNVTIVPVGLNYFNPDKFRSRAVVEYGDPIKVERRLVNMYGCGGDKKRQACSELLGLIREGLQRVTLNLPDYESYQLVHMAKDMYKSSQVKYSGREELELARRFAVGLNAKSNEPKLQLLKHKMMEYRRLLKVSGLKDDQVRRTSVSSLYLFFGLVKHICIIASCILLLSPVLLMLGPFLLIIDMFCRRKAQTALKSSSVKIRARDVVATWKIILGAILFPVADALWATVCSYALFGQLKRRFLVFFFLLLFPAAAFTAVKAFEQSRSSINMIRPLWLALSNPDGAFSLRSFRHELRTALTSVVDEFGPEVITDFDDLRIVQRRRLSSAHNALDKSSTGHLRVHQHMQTSESIDSLSFEPSDLELDFSFI